MFLPYRLRMLRWALREAFHETVRHRKKAASNGFLAGELYAIEKAKNLDFGTINKTTRLFFSSIYAAFGFVFPKSFPSPIIKNVGYVYVRAPRYG